MRDYSKYTQNSLTENQSESETVLRDTRRRKPNNMLLIITIILAAVAIAVSASALILLMNKDSDPDDKKSGESITQKESDEEISAESEESAEKEPEKEEPQYAPETMYANCDTTLTLRSGPGADYPKLASIPAGDAVIRTGLAENGFSKVSYAGMDGYASDEYLSYTRPYVWEYDETEVENFVRDVLYAYVDAINTDDVDVLTQYLSGSAVTDAKSNHSAVKKTVDSELVLSVNCYGAKRISRTRVTVIRESTIRVYKKDGTQKDAVEKYLTTVENTGDGMYVVGYSPIK